MVRRKESSFKSEQSKAQAEKLRFTERQATAILEMRLYKLIGLEIEALMKEHDQTMKNIARYSEILNNYDEMQKVIIADLERYKKSYGEERKTDIVNAQAAGLCGEEDRGDAGGISYGPFLVTAEQWIQLPMREIRRHAVSESRYVLPAAIRTDFVSSRTPEKCTRQKYRTCPFMENSDDQGISD